MTTLFQGKSALLQVVPRVAHQDSASNTHLPTIPTRPISAFAEQPYSIAAWVKALFEDGKLKKVQELQKYLEKLATTKDRLKNNKFSSFCSPQCQNTSLAFWLNCYLTWV